MQCLKVHLIIFLHYLDMYAWKVQVFVSLELVPHGNLNTCDLLKLKITDSHICLIFVRKREEHIVPLVFQQIFFPMWLLHMMISRGGTMIFRLLEEQLWMI